MSNIKSFEELYKYILFTNPWRELEYTSTSDSIFIPNYYVVQNTGAIAGNGNYCYTKPILVMKGGNVRMKFYGDRICYLAKTTGIDSTAPFTPILNGSPNANTEYTYIPTEDHEWLVFCCHKNTNFSYIKISHGTTAEQVIKYIDKTTDVLDTPTDTGSDTYGKVYSADAINTIIADIEDKALTLDYSKQYLTFECLTDGTITIRANGAEASETISYSTDDGSTWTNLTTSTTEQSLGTFNIGDKVLVKGTNNSYATSSYYNQFGGTAQTKVYGNIMSLIYGDDFIGQTSFPSGSTYIFNRLFYNYTNLIDASNLILPATTLKQYCYYCMFIYCSSLRQAPELPATILADYCYMAMFQSCISLTHAPELPATILKKSCYDNMFYGCASLTQAPELPAVTLANWCYSTMFRGCTSLVNAPELPASTLAINCYINMFSGCTSLIQAPELPATTLAYYCYDGMFYGCTSLRKAPELHTNTLVDYCYHYMFYGCTSLNEITCLATDIPTTSCIHDWVNGVSSKGAFIKHPNMNSWATGTSGIPTGWTVYDAYAKENNEFDDLINVDHTYYVQKSNSVVLPLSHPDMSTQPSILPERFGKYYTYEVLIPIFGDRNVVDGDEITDDEIIPYISDDESYLTFKEGDLLMKDSMIISASIVGNGVYDNPTIVKDKYGIDYGEQYLTYISLEDNNVIEWYHGTSNEYHNQLSYSLDEGKTWIEATEPDGYSHNEIITINTGDRIMFKGVNTLFSDGDGYNNRIIAPMSDYNVEGNIMSIIYGDEFIGKTSFPEGCNLPYFFSNQHTGSSGYIHDASNLILPATTLTKSCYSSMFRGCAYLTHAPELPATTLTEGCYNSMFEGCTRLTKAPELPATTLAEGCYTYMFNSCTSLNTAPELPATTLAEGCYTYMFNSCTSLAKAPELPAITLTSYCYQGMFQNCAGLNEITCLATDISATSCTLDWVQNVVATGTFYHYPGYHGWTLGNNGIPISWNATNASTNYSYHYQPSYNGPIDIYKIFTLLPLGKYASKMNYLLVKYCNEAYLGDGYYSDDEYAY